MLTFIELLKTTKSSLSTTDADTRKRLPAKVLRHVPFVNDTLINFAEHETFKQYIILEDTTFLSPNNTIQSYFIGAASKHMCLPLTLDFIW